jgi:hypothetical protein
MEEIDKDKFFNDDGEEDLAENEVVEIVKGEQRGESIAILYRGEYARIYTLLRC